MSRERALNVLVCLALEGNRECAEIPKIPNQSKNQSYVLILKQE